MLLRMKKFVTMVGVLVESRLVRPRREEGRKDRKGGREGGER